MGRFATNISHEHDIIKEINISDDEKKYVNGCTFKIIGYGTSDRYPTLDKDIYNDEHGSYNILFVLHHIYLRSEQDYSCYDLQIYHNMFIVEKYQYDRYKCDMRLIRVDYPQYITHNALNSDDITIKYLYGQDIENDELVKDDNHVIIKEHQVIIMCKWFYYDGSEKLLLAPSHRLFILFSNNFQEIINTKPAIIKQK